MLGALFRGRNVTCLAMGATGSGKSHTLMGPPPAVAPSATTGRAPSSSSSASAGDAAGVNDALDQRGAVPRAVAYLLERAAAHNREASTAAHGIAAASAAVRRAPAVGAGGGSSAGSVGSAADRSAAGRGIARDERAVLCLSIVEVYNDACRDLLALALAQAAGGAGRSSGATAAEDASVTVRSDGSGTTSGTGAERAAPMGLRPAAAGRANVRPTAVTGSVPHGKAPAATAPRADTVPVGKVLAGECAEVCVASTADALSWIAAAAALRITAATACNERSSRGHCLIRLRLLGVPAGLPAAPGATRPSGRHISLLTIADLAGNERVRESRVEGAALAEACAVNASLSALADCVSALLRTSGGAGTSSSSISASHIPFRSSTLTRLLEPGLSGDARTLVVVNVSAAPLHRPQTLATLRFASAMAATPVTPLSALTSGAAKLRSALLQMK